MDKEIIIEKSRNQKEEKIPLFQTYYLSFVRNYDSEDWFSCSNGSTNKDEIIKNVREVWKDYKQVKIISFELPF